MRLSTQLSLSLLLLLIVIFTGSFVINFKLTKEYVDEQLATHAQDTATSLGLSITPYLSEPNGLVVAETMVNAIFDRGFYQYITVADMNGNLLIERRNPNNVDTVPGWFSSLVEVTPPKEKTELNDGWTLAGELTVQSHPGLANATLWESVKQSAYMFFAAFIVAYVALLFIISAITKPLRIVVTKINDIQQQKFSKINYKPFTKELGFITSAINNLSQSVENMYVELTNKAEQFKAQAFHDDLTKLSNRNAFTRHLNVLLASTVNSDEGYLILIRLAHLNIINTSIGAQEGDEYVVKIANELKKETVTTAEKVSLFRISGADFVMLAESTSQEETKRRVERLAKTLNSLTPIKDGSKTVWIGAAKFTGANSFSEVMENADSALLAATKLDKGWQFASELKYIHSNTAWRERLNSMLAQRNADIMVQPIIDISGGKEAYLEAFGRFKDKASGDIIPMSQLIPVSERLNLIPEVDKLVVSLIMEKLQNTSQSIAVNLANASIANNKFRNWLLSTLKEDVTLCNHLIFEIEDSALLHFKENTISLCRSLMDLGCMITIEHFGDNLASLSGLRALQPNFVKISGKLTKDIHTNEDNQLFISSLVSIARGLNVSVIAEIIESEEESLALTKLNVNYQQGYFFSKPALW